MTDPRTGALLLNLGTPESPSVPDVRRYLREFLSDPRVIDIPALARWLLLNLVILPFRPRKSAAAYAKIWTSEGLPAADSRPGARGCRQRRTRSSLGWSSWGCATANRRSRRQSRDSEMPKSRGSWCCRCFPSTQRRRPVPRSQSSRKKCNKATTRHRSRRFPRSTTLRVSSGRSPAPQRSHFADSRRISSCSATTAFPSAMCARAIEAAHTVSRATAAALRSSEANRDCYRAQCFATTRAVAEILALEPERHATAFQSRLGRTPWIQPFTDHILVELAARGIKRLAVICPSFTADCLETLEEIGIRAAEQWRRSLWRPIGTDPGRQRAPRLDPSSSPRCSAKCAPSRISIAGIGYSGGVTLQ